MPETKFDKSTTDHKENKENESNEAEAYKTGCSWEENNQAWSPWNIHNAKDPVYFQKKKSSSYDFDDCEGWGEPPPNPTSWNDSHQGYCKELIEEQKKTTFWSIQNGVWVNVTEEERITSSRRHNIRRDTTKRGDIWDKIKKQSRRDFDFKSEEGYKNKANKTNKANKANKANRANKAAAYFIHGNLLN